MFKKEHVYTGDIVPEDNVIFVFGSNTEGRHGAGSAKVAVEQFGAKYGVGEGLCGNSYALPTVDFTRKKRPSRTEAEIVDSIVDMYLCAWSLPSYTFKIAYRSKADEKTLCGYTGKQLLLMFLAAYGIFYKKYKNVPKNIQFSEEWSNIEL